MDPPKPTTEADAKTHTPAAQDPNPKAAAQAPNGDRNWASFVTASQAQAQPTSTEAVSTPTGSGSKKSVHWSPELVSESHNTAVDIHQIKQEEEEDGEQEQQQQQKDGGGIRGSGLSSSQPSEEDQARIRQNDRLVAGKAGDEKTCLQRDHQADLSVSSRNFLQANLCRRLLRFRSRRALISWN